MTTPLTTDEQDQILAIARGMYSNLGITLSHGPSLYRITFPHADLIFSREKDEFVRVTIHSYKKSTTDLARSPFQSLVNLHTTNHIYDHEIGDVLQLWKDMHIALTLRLAKDKEGQS